VPAGGKKSANRATVQCTYRVGGGRGDEGKGIKKEKIREWKTCRRGIGRQIKTTGKRWYENEKIRELLERGGRNALENDSKRELSNSAYSFVGREREQSRRKIIRKKAKKAAEKVCL
jgi:hypothetical protein